MSTVMTALAATNRRSAPQALRRERGVTLIVALVMLVIIGLTSVAVMRNSMATDVVANNARVQTLAMQAAQIALRHCEDGVAKLPATPPFTIYDAPASSTDAMRWESFANWFGGSAIAYTIPQAQMQSTASAFVPAKLPQCIVQRSPLTMTYVITTRGFSPDYDEDASGRTKTGSVVWLQSTMTAGS